MISLGIVINKTTLIPPKDKEEILYALREVVMVRYSCIVKTGDQTTNVWGVQCVSIHIDFIWQIECALIKKYVMDDGIKTVISNTTILETWKCVNDKDW